MELIFRDEKFKPIKFSELNKSTENKMKDYEELEDEVKQELEAIADNDPYGLSPKTLYKNILCSTGNDETLSKIFEVPLSLMKRIKQRE